MADKKVPFFQQLKSFPRQFWVANTMEIFERLSWYGWFTVMALYVTGSVETGGLGFSTETRGALMGIVPFFLYLFPVVTGAMADRYGYKKSFILAYSIMILAYYLLGQFTSLPSFFMSFMFVAVGAAIFKPVVVGTVAKVTDESNSALGFGVFYMMVNIGGFLGPIVAGKVRGLGWEYVFYACSGWAIINLIIVFALYEEPEGNDEQRNGSIGKVFDNMVEVLGNLRFFITVFVVLFALMFASLRNGIFAHVTWTSVGVFIPAWLVLNVIWDRLLPAGSGKPVTQGAAKRNPLAKRMYCSNWRFAVFLLIMSGFWTSFNQIFITMPEYIRDFTETRPMISAAEVFGEGDEDDPNSGAASVVATISPKERKQIANHVRPVALVISGQNTSGIELWPQIFSAVADAPSSATPEERQAVIAKIFVASGKAAPNPAMLGELFELAQRVNKVPAPVWDSSAADQLRQVVADRSKAMTPEARDGLSRTLIATSVALLDSKVRLAPDKLLTMIEKGDGPAGEKPWAYSLYLPTFMATGLSMLTDRTIVAGRQFNPEFIINIDAGAIILFQVLISILMAGFHRFTTMIVGMFIAAFGIGLSALAGAEGMIGAGGSVWIVAAGLFIFAIGEMMASPTSQEYVGRIAPADKKALYMGYYFVAIALGNLFGGILSGEMYGTLARDMQRPDLMWAGFGGIMVLTAIAFICYNKFALSKEASESLTE